MRNRQRTYGFMMMEAVVSMAVLSISIVGIHQALRQAILVRAQARDYTTARFLMQQKLAELEMELQLAESKGEGVFEPPDNRFSYSWEVTKVEVPMPAIPDFIPPEQRDSLKEIFKGYMAHVSVSISWTRAGKEYGATGETLLPPENLWLPPDKGGK